MAKRESSPGISPAKINEYGIEAGQILMQNIQERLTGIWPATGASSRRTARFAVSISVSLTAGLTTSVDMGKATKQIFFKNHGFPRIVPHFFSRNLTFAANAQFSIIFSKVFKLKFFLNFFHV